MQIWLQILITILGSSGFAALISAGIQTLKEHRQKKKNVLTETDIRIQAVDKKLDKLIDKVTEVDTKVNTLETKIDEVDKNEVRTQLMLLFCDYPQKSDEIFTVAKRYFIDLNGNSYIKNLFEDWAKKNEETLPDWFIDKFYNK